MPRCARCSRKPACTCAWSAPRGLEIDQPRQLVVPAGIQVEDIYPGHEHIDLVYFARARDAGDANIDPSLAALDQVGWYAQADLAALGANDEIQAWVRRAVDELRDR